MEPIAKRTFDIFITLTKKQSKNDKLFLTLRGGGEPLKILMSVPHLG